MSFAEAVVVVIESARLIKAISAVFGKVAGWSRGHRKPPRHARKMPTMGRPNFQLHTLGELADECRALARELDRKAKRTPEERRALAERTAELLREIARDLSGSEHMPGTPEFAATRTVGGIPVAYANEYSRSAASLRTLLLGRAAEQAFGPFPGRDWCQGVNPERRAFRYRMAYDSEAGFLDALAELERDVQKQQRPEG